MIRPGGPIRLDDVERIVDGRRPHVDESADQRVEPTPQQASLQRTRLGAPQVQVVLDELRLWWSGEAGVELVHQGLEDSDVFGGQIGGAGQDSADGRVETFED